MWKWIAGILLLIVLLFAVTCYRIYRKTVSGGDTAIVTLHATPEHVFASLADADSMRAWMPPGTQITPLDRGPLKVGDSIQIATRSLGKDSTTFETPQVYVLREAIAPSLVVFDLVGFNSVGAAYVQSSRRDSLVAVGDSTRLYSTVTIADLTGGRGAMPDSGTGSTVVRKLVTGAMRMDTERKLGYLKRHIENQPQH